MGRGSTLTGPWKRFREWERGIHPQTWRCQPEVLAWAAARVAEEAIQERGPSDDPVVQLGTAMRTALFREMDGKWSGLAHRLRVLVHVPSYAEFPAACSFQRNLGAGLARVGVPTIYWREREPLAPVLNESRPTLMLAVDRSWLQPSALIDPVNVTCLQEYRRRNFLTLGITCNHPDASTLPSRLEQCRSLGVDFFYSSHAPDFVRRHYREFMEAGFPVASCEFGANPMCFFPVSVSQRDLNFAYFGSANGEKWERYYDYFDPLVRKVPGLILGAGWAYPAVESLPDDCLRHIYARARVGINLHVPSQIALPTEINERAYNLAACGVPQVTDWPALLQQRLGEDGVFAASTPQAYWRLFRLALADPLQAQQRALLSLERVLRRHTVLHRADALLGFIVNQVWSRC